MNAGSSFQEQVKKISEGNRKLPEGFAKFYDKAVHMSGWFRSN